MELNLHNKIALVTGGSHGIGKAIVQSLLEEKCNVIFIGKTEERVYDLVHELAPIQDRLGVHVLGLVSDLTKENSFKKCIDSILNRWNGGVDIVINNVGGGGRSGYDLFDETSNEIWNEVYQKNVLTAVEFTNTFLLFMASKGWGRVVTISSVYGKEGGGRPWFTAAKAAEIAMMKSYSKCERYIHSGITFNTIAPGYIDVRYDKATKVREFEENRFLVPIGRMGRPEEVASLVTFLCSDKAAYINGACISVDGGFGNSF